MSHPVNSYCYCFVPGCKNTAYTAPDKFFFNVPKGDIRKEWCRAVGRNPNSLSLKSPHKCCQDHFTLEKDTRNWFYYKTLMDAGHNPVLRLRKDALPRSLQSQGNIDQSKENDQVSKVVVVTIDKIEHCQPIKSLNLGFEERCSAGDNSVEECYKTGENSVEEHCNTDNSTENMTRQSLKCSPSRTVDAHCFDSVSYIEEASSRCTAEDFDDTSWGVHFLVPRTQYSFSTTGPLRRKRTQGTSRQNKFQAFHP